MIAGKEFPGDKGIGRKESNTRVGAERPRSGHSDSAPDVLESE